MADHVYVNANKTAVVDRFKSNAKMWKLPVAEAIELGLLPQDYTGQERRVETVEEAHKPKRRTTKRK